MIFDRNIRLDSLPHQINADNFSGKKLYIESL